MKSLVAFFCLVAITSAVVINTPTVISSGSGGGSVVQSAPLFVAGGDHSDSVASSVSSESDSETKCLAGNKTIGVKPGLYKVLPDGCVEFLSDLKSRAKCRFHEGMRNQRYRPVRSIPLFWKQKTLTGTVVIEQSATNDGEC